MADEWVFGNADDDGEGMRGWLLGHFIQPPENLRNTQALEVKWARHPAGDKRPEWTSGDQRTTLLLLVEGEFRISLSHASTVLKRQGDYAMWGPGIDHIWEALTDSLVITVRWPSLPNA